MPTSSPMDDWLDEWDGLLNQRPDASLEDFIRARCKGAPASQVQAFRVQARKLAAMNRRLDTSSRPATGKPSHANPQPVLAPGAEPIPGYRLAARLGQGGFGEVWRAAGPGGFPVALKFVRLGRGVDDAERRSLDVIRGIRHPHLLGLFGSWERDGWLIIASELADRTLEDRLHQAKSQGHAGIPREELLRYMADAAEALDHLNGADAGTSGSRRGVQHRDVKPQNLLLVGGSLKVGDYGLARVLERTVTGHTGSLTFAYAAPEFFAGRTSDRSDQYSLAVTYCQLRGGRLPFTGDRHALMKAHLEDEPDLSMLPEGERPAVRRALSKEPRDRWPSCRAFVAAIQNPAAVPLPRISAGTSKPSLIGTPSTVGPRKPWPRRGLAVAGGLVVVVLLAVALPFLIPFGSDGTGNGDSSTNPASSRGVAGTILSYADRSYQGSSWKQQTDAIALAEMAPLPRDQGFDEITIQGVLGWDDDDYRVVADGRMAGLVFRCRQGRWSFESRLDGARYPSAALLDRDRLALAPGYDRAESQLFILSPKGTERLGPIRGCRAIVPVGSDTFYCACEDHPLVKYDAGKRRDIRPGDANAAFVRREDGTPLRDYPVNQIFLARAYAEGKAFGVASGEDGQVGLVEYREGDWFAGDELPDDFKVTNGWLYGEDGVPTCFVLVGLGGMVHVHRFDGRSFDSPVPAGSESPDLIGVWGNNPEKFWVMDRRGNVWERRGSAWHAVVEGLPFANEEELFFRAWTAPSGKVVAVNYTRVYVLE